MRAYREPIMRAILPPKSAFFELDSISLNARHWVRHPPKRKSCELNRAVSHEKPPVARRVCVWRDIPIRYKYIASNTSKSRRVKNRLIRIG